MSLASILHYDVIKHCEFNDEDFGAEGNIEFLRRQAKFSKIQATGLREIKEFLLNKGIDVCYMG